VSVTGPRPDAKVYDFRITTSGWARITMQGRAGATVYIEYSERLNADGTVQIEGSGSTGQTDAYTFKGRGPETYAPKFGWKGYRYIEVTTSNSSSSDASSPPPLPRILSITGVIAHTALRVTGGFRSSSELLNRFHVAMRNTILNNQYSYGSDTPAYEKGGWTNDNGDYATSAMANLDAAAYYVHMLQNFDDAQGPAGNVGYLVPPVPGGDILDPLWGGSFLLIEYDMFENYGDLGVIRRDYRHMVAYMDNMSSQIAPTGYLYPARTIGDWLIPPNSTPPSDELLGSMFLYREAKDLAAMARAIGNAAGQRKYDRLASQIAHAVNRRFYDSMSHRYRDPGSAPPPTGRDGYDQTANVIALAFGLAPAGDRDTIAAGLAADVVAQGNHLTTGVNGSKYILPMLTEAGYGDVAYRVATNPTAPGWAQWFLQCGATTMWEGWENVTCTSDRSHDHAFMGTVDDWLFEDVAGIQPTSPGFTTVQIKPYPVGDLTFASGYETSPLGRVSSSWRRSGRTFRLVVQIPVGARASVFVPAVSAGSVTESGRALRSANGVAVVGMRHSYLQLKLGSGTYSFRSTVARRQNQCACA
jgi:alpha-L-rhamnosidase